MISSDLALGETESTAYRGDRGKIAYDYSQVGHIPESQKASANGVATLDSSTKIPIEQISPVSQEITQSIFTPISEGEFDGTLLEDTYNGKAVFGTLTLQSTSFYTLRIRAQTNATFYFQISSNHSTNPSDLIVTVQSKSNRFIPVFVSSENTLTGANSFLIGEQPAVELNIEAGSFSLKTYIIVKYVNGLAEVSVGKQLYI
jgi:hypothetical protein